MLTFVNEKTIDGKTYTAMRESTNPTLQYIRCGDVPVQVRLKDVWPDDAKIVALFPEV